MPEWRWLRLTLSPRKSVTPEGWEAWKALKSHWPAGDFTRRPPKFLSAPRTPNQASATAKSAEWQFSNLRILWRRKIHFEKHSFQHSPLLKSSLSLQGKSFSKHPCSKDTLRHRHAPPAQRSVPAAFITQFGLSLRLDFP